MHYTIYQITHIESGKIYIGKHQTKNLDDSYMGSGKVLRNAIKKHGLAAFKKEILHVFETEAEMNEKEAEIVSEEFVSREDTYNICPGGKGGWGYANMILSKEHYRKAALLSTGLKVDKETRRQRAALGGAKSRGRILTDDHKNKISSANKDKQQGLKNSQYGTMWITNGIENRKIKKSDSIPYNWHKGRFVAPK